MSECESCQKLGDKLFQAEADNGILNRRFRMQVAEIERLRAMIADVVRLAGLHTESRDYGKVYHYNARWNRDSDEWKKLVEVAEAANPKTP